jgi:type I restriction enzyme S subunit
MPSAKKMISTAELTASNKPCSPKGWHRVRFGDVIRDVMVRVDPETSGLERYIAGEHLGSNDMKVRRWGTIGDGYLGPAFYRKFVKGQVLYLSRRPYLRKMGQPDFDGVCGEKTFVLEPKGGQLIPELLPYILQVEAFTEYAVSKSIGSVNPHVRFSDIANYHFWLPSDLAEQRRIADLLRAADDAVEAWRRVRIEIEEALAAFTRDRFCAAEWPRKKLGDLIRGLTPGSSVVGMNEPARNGKYGVLKISAVGASGFVSEENKVIINQSDFDPQFIVRRGDLLMTRCNTRELVGRVCVVDGDYPTLMLCDKTIRIDEDPTQLAKSFLLDLLKSPEVRLQIEGKAKGTGGAMKNISQADIRSLYIPVPPLERQQELEAIAQGIRDSLKAASERLGGTLTVYRQILALLLSAPSETP